jgi:putative methyltransferase (TIGR04325 family)
LATKRVFFIVLKIIQIIFIKFSQKNHGENTFQTFQEAERACLINDYESDDLVDVVIAKNNAYSKKLNSNSVLDLNGIMSFLPFASMNTGKEINVVDFGGGAGYHFVNAKLALNKKFNWFVIETPKMAKYANKYSNIDCRFYSDFSVAVKEMKEIDLIFTSSSLQYCSDPLVELENLLKINARYIFITRTPFLENSKKIITIQCSKLSRNGPGPLPNYFSDRKIQYPITYVSRKLVENLINQKYEIRYKINEGSSSFKFKNEPINMTGFFCVRKDY